MMFDVIDFLESVGEDARWRHAGPEALSSVLSEARAEPAVREGVLDHNERRLARILGIRTFCCYINPAKEDEEDGDVKEGDDKKDHDDGEAGRQPAKKSVEQR